MYSYVLCIGMCRLYLLVLFVLVCIVCMYLYLQDGCVLIVMVCIGIYCTYWNVLHVSASMYSIHAVSIKMHTITEQYISILTIHINTENYIPTMYSCSATAGLDCIEPENLHLLIFVRIPFLIHAKYIPSTCQYMRVHANTNQYWILRGWNPYASPGGNTCDYIPNNSEYIQIQAKYMQTRAKSEPAKHADLSHLYSDFACICIYLHVFACIWYVLVCILQTQYRPILSEYWPMEEFMSLKLCVIGFACIGINAHALFCIVLYWHVLVHMKWHGAPLPWWRDRVHDKHLQIHTSPARETMTKEQTRSRAYKPKFVQRCL